MTVLGVVLREVAGLFVEDEILTALVLLVVAAVAAFAFIAHASPVFVGGLLVLGVLAALAVSTIRGAR
jgi:hypothetical protein